MPFIGTPVVEQISDRLVRITGVALDPSDVGTIGLDGATGTPPDILLPAAFQVAHYTYGGTAIPLTASIQVWDLPVSDGPLTNLPVSIEKTGNTVAAFRITVTNTNVGLKTQDLEFYVEFHSGRVAQPANLMGV